MTTVLREIAHARSGDKGDIANIGLIASEPEYYPILEAHVTADRVAEHFSELREGPVERYEMPNIGALNFVIHDALGGGGVRSLRLDNQGKTYSAALLRMEIETDMAP
ncbi:hypothetical protein [Haloglomus litoreum]|uniref:AtuA-related protein n=1 Tax=Haloglomus litoreum TaxID=3034026 RepID=UPI0023E7E951|nr:hypothetical protein [Haloglomus sp. DT116]